jgi:hypothetical protein
MAFPVFAPGDVLNASDMNAVGLWKVTAATVSATTIVVNNCFSADYDNYLVRFVGHASNTNDLVLRMRVGGVDESGASAYRWGRIFVGTNAATAFGSQSNQTSSSINVTAINSTAGQTGIVDIVFASPFKTVWTTVHSTNNAGSIVLSGGSLQNSTSYDGFSITGTDLTGTVTVYGYRV